MESTNISYLGQNLGDFEEGLTVNIDFSKEGLSQITQNLINGFIEVQNGLSYKLWSFKGAPNNLVSFRKMVHLFIEVTIFSIDGLAWEIDTHIFELDNKNFLLCTQKNNPYINSFLSEKEKPGINLELKKAIDKYNLLATPSLSLDSEEKIQLRKDLTSSNLIQSTLAAEILTANGEYSVPEKQFSYISKEVKFRSEREQENSDKSLFEDRINVDAYNFYELVHPSYARQSVALSKLLMEYSPWELGEEKVCLDVGTGPGSALLMQSEILKDIKFHAIEPSPQAYEYLKKNTKNKKGITSECVDFLKYSGKKVKAIVSTGASHHLNTAFFFQKANELLEKGGAFVVADEMISDFSSIRERKENLILHHISYMKDLLFDKVFFSLENILEEEKQLINLFHNILPLILIEAFSGEIERAEDLCKKLLVDLDSLNLGSNISHSLISYYRLMYLELEALVAGLDYSVEQKTSPRRFLEMARQKGFELIEHVRVHKTHGRGNLDTGTHVFALKKI